MRFIAPLYSSLPLWQKGCALWCLPNHTYISVTYYNSTSPKIHTCSDSNNESAFNNMNHNHCSSSYLTYYLLQLNVTFFISEAQPATESSPNYPVFVVLPQGHSNYFLNTCLFPLGFHSQLLGAKFQNFLLTGEAEVKLGILAASFITIPCTIKFEDLPNIINVLLTLQGLLQSLPSEEKRV